MSFNGAGVFQLAAGNPVVTGTVISSTWANNTLSDIANNGLSNCIAKDGQSTPTADISFAGFKLTNVGVSSTRTGVPNAGQVQDGGLTLLSSVAGTDTITANSAPAFTSYVAGQVFTFIAAGSNVTTSVTLNVNGLGAKSVAKNGSTALAVGDIQSGQSVSVFYDGTRFQMVSPIGLDFGRLLNVQIFTSTGTYTRFPGVAAQLIHAVGGGGAGAGTPVTGASQCAVGGPGGSGAYAEVYFATPIASGTTITIGAGGVAAAGAGTSGGTTSVGSSITCPGGRVGTGAGPSAPPLLTGGGAGATGFATQSGGQTIVLTTGNPAQLTFALGLGTTAIGASPGADGPWGGGGNLQAGNAPGNAGTAPGAGGSGCVTNAGQASIAGGSGASGRVVIYEFGAI